MIVFPFNYTEFKEERKADECYAVSHAALKIVSFSVFTALLIVQIHHVSSAGLNPYEKTHSYPNSARRQDFP